MKQARLFNCLYAAIFCLLWSPAIHAFHIVGGELTYECLGGSNYRLSLTVYRDCYSTGAPFDNPAYIFIFTASGTLLNTLSIAMPPGGPQRVNPPDNICLNTLPDVCVETLTYTTIVNLPPISGGYTLVYQRYSRNSTIVNIYNPDQTGSSYTTTIPPATLANCNNSPVFNSLPPIVICAGEPLYVDQSAFDVDGDSLVYELCAPLVGGSDACPQPGDLFNCNPAGDPAPSPPYNTVDFIPPYSGTNPLGGSPPVTINPQTGLLTGVPTTIGQFVVGICVTEYRNGLPINSIRRDFQFNVTNCQVVQAAVQSDNITPQGDYIITDCGQDFTVDFINTSLGASSYFWTFGDPTVTTDFSSLFNPSYTYPDTGQYVVTLVADSGIPGCIDTATIFVRIYPTLTNNFSYVAGCAYDPVVFTDLSTTTYGIINAWSWSFGDGSSTTEQNPAHTYADGGTKTVSLSTTTSLGCQLTIQQNIYVAPVPVANFTASPLCINTPVQFTDITSGAPPALWQWNFGDGGTSGSQSPIHTYTNAGTYTVTLTVTTAENCVDDWQNTFTIYPDFTANAGPDTEICAGDVVQLQANADFPWFIYQWSPPDGILSGANTASPQISPTSNITYTLTISDPNGCSRTDNLNVTVNPQPSVSITGNNIVCLGDNATLTANIGANITNFTWTGGGLNNSTDAVLTVAPTDTTAYILTVLDSNNCTNADTFTVIVQFPITANAGGSAEFCAGQSVQLTASGGISYQWSPPLGLSNAGIANPLASPLNTTQYTVTVSNNCFSDTASVLVIVNPLPVVNAGPDATINVGETITLSGSAQSSAGGLQYTWTPPDGLDDPALLTPVASPLATTVYYLSATDANGCAATDSLRLDVTNIFEVLLPNAFSPNKDGVNDGFGIVRSRGLKELLEFRVYNRWGQLIFETNDFTARWDGNFKGVPQELGVYVFYIKALTFLDNEYVQQGNITLIR